MAGHQVVVLGRTGSGRGWRQPEQATLFQVFMCHCGGRKEAGVRMSEGRTFQSFSPHVADTSERPRGDVTTLSYRDIDADKRNGREEASDVQWGVSVLLEIKAGREGPPHSCISSAS